MNTKKPAAIAAAEAELHGLQKRRSSLQARADAAAAAADKARAERRALLTGSDDPAPAKLAAADRVVRDAEDARAAADEAGEEINGMIDAVGLRLAGLLEAEQRDQRATQMEANAAAADAAVERLRKAAGEIDAARQALAKAMGTDAIMFYDPPVTDPDRSWVTFLGKSWFDFHGYDTREIVTPLAVETIAARIAGHILAPVLPACAITSDEEITSSAKPMGPTQALCPVADQAAARRLIVDPMRAAAAALRAHS